jgi:hypothetical protein
MASASAPLRLGATAPSVGALETAEVRAGAGRDMRPCACLALNHHALNGSTLGHPDAEQLQPRPWANPFEHPPSARSGDSP